ncbi:hypothetical protein GCM10027168_05710 [Streptomyces capparidis]
MAGALEWLAAGGGIVGAIGGPAGLWAAWHQHVQEKRRRQAPPPEVGDLLARLASSAKEVVAGYKEHEWWSGSGVRDIEKRLREVSVLISDAQLSMQIDNAVRYLMLARLAVTFEQSSREEVVRLVHEQAECAGTCAEWTEKAIKRFQQLS